MQITQIKQQEKTSRVISDSGKLQRKQLKGFTENRQHPIQREENLTEGQAKVLEYFRQYCEGKFWKEGQKNQEVQVGLTDTGVLIIGYNYGIGNGFSFPEITPIKINDTKTELNNYLNNNKDSSGNKIFHDITEIKFAKPASPPDAESSVHAEISILYFILNNILEKIILEKTTNVNIYIRGKKYTCENCKNLIKSFDADDLKKCLNVHTPSLETHRNTSSENRQIGVRKNVPKWKNPLEDLSLSIAKAKKKFEHNIFLNALEQLVKPKKENVLTESSIPVKDTLKPTVITEIKDKKNTKGILEKEKSEMKQISIKPIVIILILAIIIALLFYIYHQPS